MSFSLEQEETITRVRGGSLGSVAHPVFCLSAGVASKGANGAPVLLVFVMWRPWLRPANSLHTRATKESSAIARTCSHYRLRLSLNPGPQGAEGTVVPQ